MNIMITFVRCKYYSGWLFAEMSIASCGITFKEMKDDKPVWLNI
jgi:hypothetical protein